LHHKSYDVPITENGIKTNKIKRGYTTRFITMGVNYDWKTNPRQIYAVPIDIEEEIIEKEDSSELEEKAKAYDIITGVAE
jgi:flavoprotein